MAVGGPIRRALVGVVLFSGVGCAPPTPPTRTTRGAARYGAPAPTAAPAHRALAEATHATRRRLGGRQHVRPKNKVTWPLPSAERPRFVPRGLGFDSRECPEPPSRQAALNWHAPLTGATASAHATRAPPSEAGSCEVRDGVLAMRHACLHDGTFYVRTAVGGERLAVRTPRWGPWGRGGRAEPPVHVQPWRDPAHGPPGARMWLRGTWLFAQPRLAFSPKNVYHALDELELLDGLARRADMRLRTLTAFVSLNHRPPLLNGTLLGALLALATEAPMAYHLPPEPMPAALCFDAALLEVDQNVSALAAACGAAGAAVAGAAAPPPRAPHGTHDGFVDIARSSYARLRMHGTPPRSASAFERTRVLIVNRLSSRTLVNLPYLAHALVRAGAHVTVAAFECLELVAQIALVSRASTLIGAHGAALSLGRFLPDDGAIVELRSAPCIEDDLSWMGFRSRFAVLGAPARATVSDLPCPLWRAKTGMPFVVDIIAVLGAVRALDRVACRHARCARAPPACSAAQLGGEAADGHLATHGTLPGELRPGVPLVSVRAARYEREVRGRAEVARADAARGGARERDSAAATQLAGNRAPRAGESDNATQSGWVQPWRAWDACRRAHAALAPPHVRHASADTAMANG
ncbi:hypothetical protein KFE25_001980 [Diacronema lutheri]|uniref:Glycosyltransferase 61 catalytic domain-containing protein n=1 Tax=Diacronema lutheri TaxID=2081491 RepID=A0A8J6CB58_DIALT|nr:hypothetical protein KFE25_001980 [Diacronema lutheri]